MSVQKATKQLTCSRCRAKIKSGGLYYTLRARFALFGNPICMSCYGKYLREKAEENNA